MADAVAVGLGSMVGAGVFAAFAPAAQAAGAWLLVGLGLAALVAYANAASSAQLAAQYPTSGGAYVYGRERLGQWWGYLAGWAFVIGKTASCAAMALTFAAYLLPVSGARPAAALAVIVVVAVGYRGVTRTARATGVLVAGVLAALVVLVVSALSGGGPRWSEVEFWTASAWPPSPFGVLQAAGLLFFAFAGYARVATMGEEVRDPARTIPRAIITALLLAVGVYLVVGVTALAVLGAEGLASSTAPLADVARATGLGWLPALVRAAAAVACLGALLALSAGVSRTVLAMAREGDLPRWLAAVHPRHGVPHRAEVALGALVVALVLAVDLRGAIGFSSFGVLAYYLVANLAAWTQDRAHRRVRRAWQVVGAAGCAVLALALPPESVLAGTGVLALGLVVRAVRRRVSGSRP